MDRWEINLETERVNEGHYIRDWKYLKIGYCDGACKISFERSGPQDPNEIDSLRDISNFNYLYIDNAAQPGCSLVIYYEEETTKQKSELAEVVRIDR